MQNFSIEYLIKKKDAVAEDNYQSKLGGISDGYCSVSLITVFML